MWPRLRTALAYGGLAVTILLSAASLVLLVATRSTPVDMGTPRGINDTGTLLAAIAFAAVGALILVRRPGNPVGWLFWAMGPAIAVNILAKDYAIYALFTRHDTLPGGVTAAWLQSWSSGVPVTLGLSLLLLLFPDGRLLGPRWRIAAWSAAIGFVLVVVGGSIYPEQTTDAFRAYDNPYGVDAIGGAALVATAIGWFTSLFALLAAAISLVLRLRRARGVERQQLKWLASAGLALALTFIATTFTESALAQIASTAAGIAIPVAAGVAILRHGLYDIDVVLNRALVYGSLSAVLAGAYFGLVVLLQLALRPLTGGSGLAVALSTLAVAALFRPARARVQALVDRRFYRGKYDAERTVADFATRLRDEVDLATLTANLHAVVAEAVQPAHLSLWLRDGTRTVTPAVTIPERSSGTREPR
jgi:hypothetical protein